MAAEKQGHDIARTARATVVTTVLSAVLLAGCGDDGTADPQAAVAATARSTAVSAEAPVTASGPPGGATSGAPSARSSESSSPDRPADESSDPAASGRSSPAAPATTPAPASTPTSAPASTPARDFPEQAPAVHGGRYWAVFTEVAYDFEDPELARSVDELRAVGYEAGVGDVACTQGAAETFGLDPDRSYAGVSLLFASPQEAQQFVDAYAPGVVGTAEVTAYCLD